MKVRVVCVSRTFGSVGVALAQVLAEKLGFRYVDEEVIERAAAKAKLSPEELAATERKPSVMKRLLESIGVAGMDMVRKTMDFDYYDLRGKEPEPAPDDHRALIRQAIHEIAEEGGAVIVAHAASMALAARTDVLRVLVTASPGGACQACRGPPGGRRPRPDRQRRRWSSRLPEALLRGRQGAADPLRPGDQHGQAGRRARHRRPGCRCAGVNEMPTVRRAVAIAIAIASLLVVAPPAPALGPAPSDAPATPSPAGTAREGAEPAPTRPRALPTTVKPWTGDFEAMLDRRLIRVLVPFSRTLYFNDRGRERGLTAELVRDFEGYLNKKYAKRLGKRPLTVYMIPTTRDRLIPGLVQGLGDIAAGNLTVTEGRLEQVDFFAPELGRPVSEIVVTGPSSPQVGSLDDLAGKTVHVRKASSYESLTALNARFAAEKKPAVALVLVPDALEDEDLMEMLQAKLVGLLVVDDWKARLWARILPAVKPREDLVVHAGGKTGWAFRKGSPELAAALDDCYVNYMKKQGVLAVRFKQYQQGIKQITNSTDSQEWQRFQQTLDYFEKHAASYSFDPLMLAAQGYQESQLRQDAKSPVGAVGIMQLMPATGQSMKVGDIRQADANIHAGAKYMDHLMAQYFADAHFEETNRTLFAFASYNAGPAKIARMRKEAEKRGLDPNKWFNNVEIVTAEKVGRETTTYVRNIYKYYVAYKLMTDIEGQREKAREQLESGAPPPGR
ncbi:MAG: cytidylate kinase family protein [Deltaproteobacteria bacterium]|nr:cytidylate kinase family protein [Deltaproteobacteria bacterium]